MKDLKQLYDKHYEIIDSIEYQEILNDEIEGFISILYDVDLEELLNYFIHVNIGDIKSALYNGTLTFYKCNSDYIAVLES